jgi:hypothetical protein
LLVGVPVRGRGAGSCRIRIARNHAVAAFGTMSSPRTLVSRERSSCSVRQ